MHFNTQFINYHGKVEVFVLARQGYIQQHRLRRTLVHQQIAQQKLQATSDSGQLYSSKNRIPPKHETESGLIAQ